MPELILLSFLLVLAERETESKELRLNISKLEAKANDLHEKFEPALAHLEQESDETNNVTIKRYRNWEIRCIGLRRTMIN